MFLINRPILVCCKGGPGEPFQLSAFDKDGKWNKGDIVSKKLRDLIKRLNK